MNEATTRRNPLTKLQEDAKAKGIVSEKSSIITPVTINSDSSIPIQQGTLAASTSKSVLSQPEKMIASTDKKSRPALPAITKADRKGLIKAIVEFRAKEKSSKRIREGDERKNVFAFAGLSTVAAAIIFVLALAGATVGLNTIVIGGLILITTGIVLSIIGLKSERRTLARIGLWVGVGVLVFGIIMGLIYALLESGGVI